MEPLEPINQERIDQLIEDWSRMEGLSQQVFRTEWKGSLSGKSIVDIACGYHIPIGVLSFALEQGIDTQYHGYDIRDLEQHNRVYEISKEVKNGRFDKVLSQKFVKIQPRIFIHSGPAFDATSKEFPAIVSASAGQIGLLLLRHPDVRGDPDIFSTIIGTTIEMSLGNDAPLIITTSNDISRDAIYEFIDKALVGKGFRLTRNDEIESDTFRPVTIKGKDTTPFRKSDVHYSYLSPPVRNAFLGYWREYVNTAGRVISISPEDTSKFQAKPFFGDFINGSFASADDSITLIVREIKK